MFGIHLRQTTAEAEAETYVDAERIDDPFDKRGVISYVTSLVKKGRWGLPKVLTMEEVKAFAIEHACPYNIHWH